MSRLARATARSRSRRPAACARGLHRRPEVTVAVLLSGREKISRPDAVRYVGAQLAAGALAGLARGPGPRSPGRRSGFRVDGCCMGAGCSTCQDGSGLDIKELQTAGVGGPLGNRCNPRVYSANLAVLWLPGSNPAISSSGEINRWV